MDVNVVILAKGCSNPKSRLNCILSHKERVQLSFYMLKDVLLVFKELKKEKTVSVLTSDPFIKIFSRNLGFNSIHDHLHDINTFLNRYAKDLREKGMPSLLVLPSDIPMLDAEGLNTLFNSKKGGVVLVPAASDGGTNALLCSPPDSLRFQYGTESAKKHCDEANLYGIPLEVLKMDCLSYDIDTIEDLKGLMCRSRRNYTTAYLRSIQISERMV